MTVDRSAVFTILDTILTPDGRSLAARDVVRALDIQGGAVRFVIEAADAEEARALQPAAAQAEAALKAAAGVTSVQIVMTAHGPAAKSARVSASADSGNAAATSRNAASAASRCSMISCCSTSGGGRSSRLSRLLSLSQKMSRLALSRAISSA